MSRRSHSHTSSSQVHSAPPKESPGLVVALTGASSILGSLLLSKLEDDARVRRVIAVDVKPPGTAGGKTHLYEVDLTQPTAEAHLAEIFTAERVDTVVHMAFLASPTPAIAWAHEFESLGTRQLFIAATHARVHKVVMASQTFLYGAHRDNPNYLTEDHLLRAGGADPFFGDKIEAEQEAAKFGHRDKSVIVTVLRLAPVLGPTGQTYLSRYLGRRIIPTLMGFDPLVQFVHEEDAVLALKQCVDTDVPGTFNIAGDGVLRLSTVIHLMDRIGMPIPHWVAQPIAGVGWAAQLVDIPPGFLPYLRYLCVADTKKARSVMGFSPTYSSRAAVTDFARTVHKRDARLLRR